MKIAQIERVRLVEGLDRNASRTYRLWESAGYVLKEFQLDQKQIDQLFAQVEKDATAAGGNRTALGKGIDITTDAGKAVKQAYDDLVAQVQNSGPVKNFDALYDQATEKLKAATGGDSGAMSYVQKYRDFAKKHPIAQGVIYSALIAAAGLSGAGLGGAAAIGLFKMTDRLLQGDKFSSAVGKGAVAGATAYAASNILGGGDLPSDPNAPGYQVDADGPANIGNQSFAPPPETSQNFGLTPGGVDPDATQTAIDAAKDTAAKTAADAAEAGAKSAATDAAKQAVTKGSDAAALAADTAGGGVTDIDTLKQGIAAGSDAAQAATNTDAAAAMASQSDATVNTATDFASQGAPAGQAASSYAPSADTASSATDAATQAVKSATSSLADVAPGSMKYVQAEKMLENDLLKAVREAVASGDLGDPTQRGYTFKITNFVRDYIDQNSELVQKASGKALSGTSEKLIGMKAELIAKQVASGLDGASGTANWAGGALQKAGTSAAKAATNYAATGSVGTDFEESKNHKGRLIKEYIDAESTVRHWALKESLGRPRGGVRLTEAGVNRVFALVAKRSVNEGIMDTVKGAVKSAGQGLAGMAKKAGSAIAQTGKNLTTKFTADKLKKAWEAEGGNTDSEAIKIFLKQQGVDSAVIDSSMKAVGAPSTGADPAADAAKGAEAGAADASKAPAAGGSQFVQDLVAGYMALTPQERAEIMKELDVAIDVSGNSNLVKGMNESKRRKKAVR